MKKATILTLVLFLLAAFVWAQKISIVHICWSEKTIDVLQPEVANKFMAKYPNVEVKLLLYAHPDTTNKIRLTLATGGDVDTFALSNFDSSEFLNNGSCMEIMPQAFGKKTVKEVVDMWEPGSIEVTGGAWKGKYYGLPFELSSYAAWVNTKHMTEAGLNPKTDLPKYWDQFAELTRKLTVDQGGVRVRNGFAMNPKTGLFMTLVYSSFMEGQGLSWASDEDFLKSLDSPKVATALASLTDFVTKYKSWNPGLFDDDREGFGNGLTSTFLTGGTWYWSVLASYKIPKEDVTPIPYPRYRGGKDVGSPGYGACCFVNKATKNPLWAWRWADFQASFPNEWMARGTVNQPRKTQDKSLARKYIPSPDAFFADFNKSATCLSSVHFNEISDAVHAFFSRVAFEGMSTDQSLERLKEDAHSILQ